MKEPDTWCPLCTISAPTFPSPAQSSRAPWCSMESPQVLAKVPARQDRGGSFALFWICLLTGRPLETSSKCHRPALGCWLRFKGYCNDAMKHRIPFGPAKLRVAWLTFVDYNITWLELLYNIAMHSRKQQEPINEHLLIRNEIPWQ